MVAVAQLVEPWIVIPVVVGSSPISHPNLFLILSCEILFINSKKIKIMQDKELERYSRHILLPEIEFEGQKKLLQSHCLIMGAGGLGSPVAIYLAASGVGKITICDFDSVDLSNLQRQIIHEEKSIGLNKAESAKIALNRINSDINVIPIKNN